MKMLLLLLSLSLQKPDQMSYWPPLHMVPTGNTFILRLTLPMISVTSVVTFMGLSERGATLSTNSCHLVTVYMCSICQRIRSSDLPLVSGCGLSKENTKATLAISMSYCHEVVYASWWFPIFSTSSPQTTPQASKASGPAPLLWLHSLSLLCWPSRRLSGLCHKKGGIHIFSMVTSSSMGFF